MFLRLSRLEHFFFSIFKFSWTKSPERWRNFQKSDFCIKCVPGLQRLSLQLGQEHNLSETKFATSLTPQTRTQSFDLSQNDDFLFFRPSFRMMVHHSRMATHHSRMMTHHSRMTVHHSRMTSHHSRMMAHHSRNLIFANNVHRSALHPGQAHN